MTAWTAMGKETLAADANGNARKRPRIDALAPDVYADMNVDDVVIPAARLQPKQPKPKGGPKVNTPKVVKSASDYPVSLRPFFKPPDKDGKYRACLKPGCKSVPAGKKGWLHPFCMACFKAV